MVGSLGTVGVLTRCVLLYSVPELKTAQMKVYQNLIWKLLLFEFELGHNAVASTKNICSGKVEGLDDPSTVTRWFKKFFLGCKNLTNRHGQVG